jgi:predicted naringenin-chalcone synthase
MPVLCRPAVPEHDITQEPIERTPAHPGFEARNALYESRAKARVPAVVERALARAGLKARDIDVIVHVSCTGFTMPSLSRTAWFGDDAAAVVRGTGGVGVRLERNGSHLVPDSEDRIAYKVRETGFPGGPAPGTTGIIAGFGPGITAEVSLGRRTGESPAEEIPEIRREVVPLDPPVTTPTPSGHPAPVKVAS